jgi:hypothetical protein
MRCERHTEPYRIVIPGTHAAAASEAEDRASR